jgi:hypothetical protein
VKYVRGKNEVHPTVAIMRTIFSLQICMWINKTSGQCPDSGDGHHWIAVWLGWMIARPTPYPTPPRAQFSVKMASIMEGPLSKWTNVMKGWQYRWFVLDYNAGLLSYYTVCTSSCFQIVA